MAKVVHRPRYQIINGIRCPESFSPKCFREVMNYNPKPGDVFINTYPKCGTTWMQSIVLYIFRKGKELDDPIDILTMSPFIDFEGNESIEKMPRPGAFKTHLPFTHIPYSSDAKYVIVLRNPKDCCVSLFYHTKFNLASEYWEANFDEFFEIFMAGEVEYNDYFDHLMAWYPHRNNEQIFFTTYEDMKKDHKDVTIRLAKFLGKEYIEAIEKDNNVLNNILHFSGFEYMKKNVSPLFEMYNNVEDVLKIPNLSEGRMFKARFIQGLNLPKDLSKMSFLRKGQIGDWKSHFSPEQSERMSKKFFEITKGTEIEDSYKCYM